MKRDRQTFRRRGFSLLELMIVVVLIAGIVAIAWPSIARPMRKAELSEATQKLREAIEDGRYQAMMSGEPVFLQITQGDSELRSGGIDALISGELDEGSEGPDPTSSISKSTISTPARGLQSLSNLDSEASHSAHVVTQRVWKLPENIVVTSVHWTDEESSDPGYSESGSSGYDAGGSTTSESGRSTAGSDTSSYTGSTGSFDESDPVQGGQHEKWCLPMTAQGRGRDAEITLLDKRARQTVTVSFTAATGELEIVR